jgi:hypothetical protein
VSVTLQIDQAVYSSAAGNNCEWEEVRGGFAVQFLGVSVMLQIDQTPFIYYVYICSIQSDRSFEILLHFLSKRVSCPFLECVYRVQWFTQGITWENMAPWSQLYSSTICF